MLPGSGFMIILVMVLLRRIRKKMVGEKKKKKTAVDPKQALPRKWPRWSINQSRGEEGADGGTGGEERWGAFQVF